MKKAIFAAVVTSFVTTLAFASVDMNSDNKSRANKESEKLVTKLNLEQAQQQQVLAVLQQSQEEKQRIMKEAKAKIMQLQQEQQQKLDKIMGTQARMLLDEMKQQQATQNVKEFREKLAKES